MTATLTRSPLHALSMSETQRFDAVSAAASSGNGNGNGRGNTKAKANADADADADADAKTNKEAVNGGKRRRNGRDEREENAAKKVKVGDASAGAASGAVSARGEVNEKRRVEGDAGNDGAGGKAEEPIEAQKKSRGRPRKHDYDQDIDGFTFSRTKAKRKEPATTKIADEVPQVQSRDVAAVSAPTQVEQPAKARSGRTRKRSPEAEKQTTPPKRRRSARLSGESHAVGEVHQQQPRKPKEIDQSQQRSKIKTPSSAAALKIDKKRRTTMIPLPFADTPVIERNKEMRNPSGGSHRRSSSTRRGRRASSLIDSGTSNAVPHSEVPVEDFFKHISQDLLETRRMRQLLMWCATRALPKKPTGQKEDLSAIAAARVIQEELLKDFTNKNEMSDWFDRVDTSPIVLVKKPNPRNEQNIKKLKELKEEKARLENEKTSWDKLLSGLPSTLTKADPFPTLSAPTLSAGDLSSSLLTSPRQTSILQTLRSYPDVLESTKTRLATATDSLEFKIDSFAAGVHTIQNLREELDETSTKLQRQATDALDQRDKEEKERAGTEKVRVRDVLGTLGRVG